MLKLGSHVAFKAPDYLVGSAKFSVENGANTAMIFLGAPQNTRRVSVDKYMLDEYLEQYSDKLPLEDIIVHGPYIVNPSNPAIAEFAVEFLTQEIERMEHVGLKYLVIHPGAAGKQTPEEAIKTCVSSLKQIVANTNSVEILIETMSGKGTEIGRNLDEIKAIVDGVDSPRVGVCLDTCHLFASGYDLSDYDGFMKELMSRNLIDQIKCIHVNDSQHDIGTNKDRHANIGDGFIPTKAIRDIVQGKELMHAIKVLETPWVDGVPIYKKEIELLK